MVSVNLLVSLLNKCLHEVGARSENKDVVLKAQLSFRNLIDDLVHAYLPDLKEVHSPPVQ